MNRIQITLAIILMSTCIWSCEEDQHISCYDELKQKAYYESEIFEEAYMGIYGKWELYEVFGGFAGSSLDVSPENYLEFVKYGVYGFLESDSIISCGRVVISETDLNILLIDFENSAGANVPFDVLYSPRFVGKDTLILDPHCSDCFYYSYKRVK